MKNDYTIAKQYQEDLIKAYNKVAQSSWSQKDAYAKAVKLPAPRYYVSARQAAQVIAPMVRGDFERVNMMHPNRRRLYYSLLDKVIELSEKRAFIGKPLIYIVRFAVSSPAPEFFVTPNALSQVRSYLKKGYFDNEGKALEVPSRVKSYERLKEKRGKLKAYRAQFKNSPPKAPHSPASSAPNCSTTDDKPPH